MAALGGVRDVGNLVRVPGWDRFGWLRHGFTTRLGGGTSCYGAEGERNLGFTKEDAREVVIANRLELVEELGGGALATVSQVHGVEVLRVGAGGPGASADGMMTSTPGLLLGIMAADCVPVLLVDTRLRAVAAIHAGWRGTAAGIAGVGVGRMVAEFGSRPEDIVAAIGPSIGQCCYEVGEEVRERFAADLFVERRLDLWEANRRQLVAAGVANVTVLGECTGCSLVDGRRKYFSHRAEGGRAGRAMGVVGVLGVDSRCSR